MSDPEAVGPNGAAGAVFDQHAHELQANTAHRTEDASMPADKKSAGVRDLTCSDGLFANACNFE